MLQFVSTCPEPDPAWFARPDGHDGACGIHGLGHTRRVMVHALAICDALGIDGWELEALTLAVLWHDIGRTGDGVDAAHGAQSARKAVELRLCDGVEPRVRETALYAVTHHSAADEQGERAAQELWCAMPSDEHSPMPLRIDPAAALRVFRVLKDADALDRVRIGDLDSGCLRFEVSRSRVQEAWQLLREMP